MKRSILTTTTSILAITAISTIASADLMNPFTETFTDGNANWREADGVTELAWDPDGFVSTDAAFADGGEFGLLLFRGHDSYDSSNDAFVGDWIDAGVTTFTFDVRHDAEVPVMFFARFATSANFPAFAAITFAPVMPGEWSTVTIDVTEGSPQLIPEGPIDYEDVFGSIGNIQIGVNIPDGFENDSTMINWELDNVTIIPGPATLGVLSLGLLATSRRRRRRS